MAMKGYFAFPQALVLLEPHHQIVLCHIQDTCWRGAYPSAEVQSVYSTAPADWANFRTNANEKLRNPLFRQVMIEYYNCFSSIDMALALNDQGMLKENNPNQYCLLGNNVSDVN